MPTAASSHGRGLALEALAGKPTARVPVGPVTWGFDYLWLAADVPAWQLACGGHETWHRAHLAMVERHGVDIVFYSGAGSGPKEPTLVSEDRKEWVVRDNNNGRTYGLLKDSFTLYDKEEGLHSGDPEARIKTREDADRVISPEGHMGAEGLECLSRLIKEVGDRALVLPSTATPYILAAYAFGFEPAMEAMLGDPDLFDYASARQAAGDLPRMRHLASAGAEAIYIADSWASCDIISPAMFRRYALPSQASICQAGRDAGLYSIMWNLGDIEPVLDLEASLPCDAFAFEQPRKGFGVSVEQVREVFGPGRCLFGNLDSELLLIRNDAEEIAREVCEQIRQSGQGAPFVLSTGSPVPSDVKPSAVDVIVQAARDFRF
ncbi:MAG: uroporphyrinogen decarboxylase family protein [Anaerolineae bacterium]